MMRSDTFIMLFFTLIILTSMSVVPVASLASPLKNRRNVLASLISAGTGTTLAVGTAVLQPTDAEAAVDVSSLKPPTGTGVDVSSLRPPPPTTTAADPADTSVFLGGTYTDPQNHPGGTRSIELSGTGFAGYRLVTVRGGGGRGEPKAYELPGMIFACPGNGSGGRGGKACISIDFTPKGGPRDFQGYWDEEKGGIRFVLDNNFWPKQ